MRDVRCELWDDGAGVEVGVEASEHCHMVTPNMS